jgi:hypothetical protein
MSAPSGRLERRRLGVAGRGSWRCAICTAHSGERELAVYQLHRAASKGGGWV